MTSDSSTKPPERNWAHYTVPSSVDVAGLSVAYRRNGAGEPVVFLHGDGLTRMWLPFFEQLSERYDVIAPEQPGYGDSAIDETIQGFDDLMLHYDSFLDALGLDRVHLVGHDFGGWLAADLAVYYPKRLKSLTLMTANGLRLVDVDSIDIFRMTAEETAAALFNGREEDYSEYLNQEGFPEDLVRSVVERTAGARLTWNPRYDHKLDHRLVRVKVPTLVLGAQDDRFVPTEMAARYAELIPGAKLVTVKGPKGKPSGHALHIEHPDDVAALISDHVDSNA